jgi:hypothetical protein
VSGAHVAETILASVHMRARQQAGHMDASDLIKSMQRQSCKEGAVHIWGPDADQRAKLLIYLAVEGALLEAYSQCGSTAFSASSRNVDLNGEATTARTKQSSPIIPPA